MRSAKAWASAGGRVLSVAMGVAPPVAVGPGPFRLLVSAHSLISEAMAARKPATSRRREIAGAALKVIAERGLGRFTSLAIAREVGVSDAALFRHFPGKEAIVLAAIDRVGEILFQGFPPEDRDPLDRLGRFFQRRVALIQENPGVARLVASEQLAQAAPPEGVARVAEFR